MTLMEKLRADQLQARKDKLSVKAGLLTALISEAAMVGKNKANRESTDDEVIAMIRKFVKNAEDTAGLLPVGTAKDQALGEVAILNSYLPRMMDEEQLRSIIEQFRIANPTAKIGDVMKHLKDTHVGAYDGRTASTLATSILRG